MSNFYFFANSFLIGIFEGALAHYGRDVDVHIREHSAFDVELLLRW